MTDHDSAGTAAELDEFDRAYKRQCATADMNVCANGGPCGCARAAFISASASLRKQLDEAREWIAAQDVDMRRLAFERDESRADNVKKDAALREARDELTYHPTRKPSIIGVIDAALAPASQEAPGHTDLMVAPESIDAFLEANPLPEEAPASPKDVHIEHTLATSPSPGLTPAEAIGRVTVDPGDGTVHPDLTYVLIRGFHALGWECPIDAARDMIEAIAASPSPGLSEIARKRVICDTLGFDPENHHNAAQCPYCSPASPSRCYTPIACERGCTGDCAPASPSPRLREAVIEECAKVAEAPGFIQARDTEWDEGVNFAKRFIAAAIRALSHPVSERGQP